MTLEDLKEFLKPTWTKVKITFYILIIALIIYLFVLFTSYRFEKISIEQEYKDIYQSCCAEFRKINNQTEYYCSRRNITTPEQCEDLNEKAIQAQEAAKEYQRKQQFRQFIYFLSSLIIAYLLSCTMVYLYKKIKGH